MRALLTPIAALACLTLNLLAASAWAQTSLVSDISDHRIAINASFEGAVLTLFGSRQEEGHVVVVIRGPNQDIVVRRKERTGGIWINRTAFTFGRVPGYYSVITEQPLTTAALPQVLRRNGIGVDNLVFTNMDHNDPEQQEFAQALRRKRKESGLFTEHIGGLKTLSDVVFSTKIEFPANVPVGTYRAEVYLFRAGQIVAAQSSPIRIDKAGLERDIFNLAQNMPILYGILSVFLAVFSGWAAAQIFRRN